MKHNIEEDLRLFHPKEGLKKDEVTRTADGQEFSNSLHYSKENRLQDTHHHFVLINSKRLSGYQVLYLPLCLMT